MKRSVLKDLTAYIEFLRSLGYHVALCGFSDRFDPYTSELINYETHLHPICFYMKQNKLTAGKCHQNKLLLNRTHLDAPIYSCCFAGVEEYVFPVFYEGECLLRINLSGYRGTLKKSQKFMERVSRLCDSDFFKLYSDLNPSPPSLDSALVFIRPLEYMVTELYKECLSYGTKKEVSSQVDQVFKSAVQYINANYMYPLSCARLAEAVNYSVSYLQYVFKKQCDTTVMAYVNEVRLKRAEHLLTHTDVRIIDVAFSCGFGDSNYFSSAFKNKHGVSPKEYRAKTR